MINIRILQVIIILSVVTIYTFIEYHFTGLTEGIFSITGWTLGISFAYWIKRDSVFINSWLLTIFSIILFVLTSNFVNHNYIDIAHLPILITILFMVATKGIFRFLYVLYITIAFMIWGLLVYFTGLAYQYFSVEFIYGTLFITALNIFFMFALSRNRVKGIN